MRNSSIALQPISGALGAEIVDLNLSAEHDDATYAEIRSALNEHGVIFLRDQNLTPEQFVVFAERFGKLQINRSPVISTLPGNPKVEELRKEPHEVTNIGDQWHTDQASREKPCMGTVLLAREVPPFGGLKRTLENLHAVHSLAFLLADAAADGDPDGRFVNAHQANSESVHPVVLRHPENGRKILYVNPGYTERFEGWTRRESKPLLDYLYQHAQLPEFGCRFRWRPGSMAFWDNRQTWHYAVNDYHGYRRVMHRIVIM
jgi:taurine dioxygenase